MSFLSASRWMSQKWVNVLTSRWTGWAFFACVGLLTAAYLRYDHVVDELAACRAAAPTETERRFADELKERNNEDLESRLEDLAEHSDTCLGRVYDPDEAARNRLMRDAAEGGQRDPELDSVGTGTGDRTPELQRRDSEGEG